MSINIKEIFQSDNLIVTQDKINYNFDQILANGGGPQGLKGEKGSTGAIGSNGSQGEKGDKGDIGEKGNTGSSGYWSLDAASGGFQNSVLPKINPTGSGVASKPTNIILGMDDTTYVPNAIDKDSLLTLIDRSNGAEWSDLVRLRLYDGVDYSSSSIGIRLSPTTSGVHFKILGIGSDNITEIQSDDIRLTDSNNLTRVKITSTATELQGDVNIGNSVVIIASTSSLTNNGNTSLLGNNTIGASGKTSTLVGTVRINPTGSSPALNKILVGTDSNGTSTWKFPYEITNIYPKHTIVFVNPADITETNFALTAAAQQTTNYSVKYYGRGKVGTRWAGWYLLFGQTNQWGSHNGTTTYYLDSYVPTNVPGSLLVGASAPSTSFVTGDFDSSMGIDSFRPPIGYGNSYQPTMRGDYNGAGTTTGVTDPGDLAIDLDAASPGANYDVLNVGSLDEASLNSLVPSGNTGYPENLSLMPLPMAIYLGSTTLIYDFNSLVSQGSQGVQGNGQ